MPRSTMNGRHCFHGASKTTEDGSMSPWTCQAVKQSCVHPACFALQDSQWHLSAQHHQAILGCRTREGSPCCAQIIVFDIKAGNVLLDQDGVTAKLADVGLSKILAGSNTATLLVGPRCAISIGSDLLLHPAPSWLSRVCKGLHDVCMLHAGVHGCELSVCCHWLD